MQLDAGECRGRTQSPARRAVAAATRSEKSGGDEHNRLRGGRPVATGDAVRRAKSAQRGFREKVFSGKKF
jgi:hypothetical protein